jgi:hypothetical protein
MKPAIEPQYFDLPGAVSYMGGAISVRVLRDYIKEGDLCHIRLRGKILLARRDIDAWLAKYRQDKSVVIGIVDDVMAKFK